MTLRVAAGQLPVQRDIEANVETLLGAVSSAAAEGADILLTPEGSLSGYTHEFDTVAAEAGLEQVTGAAKAAGVGLALGTCWYEDDGLCYNQVRFYDRDGEFLGFHSKTLTCGSLTDPPEGEITHFAVQPLRTYDFHGLTVGGLICNDLWANPGCTPQDDPHLTQQLARMGAKVVFHAVNGGRGGTDWCREVVWPYHESNLRMRARCGGLWVVTCDNCHPSDKPCSAPSGVIDPGGNWVAQAPKQGEAIVVAEVEL